MKLLDATLNIELLFDVPFTIICLGVLIAVFGKAARKFPYQPDEYKAFTRPLLPRWYSKVYVVHPPPRPKRAKALYGNHENSHTQRARRHGG